MSEPTKKQMRSWLGRAKTIRRNAEKLMCEMMDTEPEWVLPMQFSDWADNITSEAGDLIHALEQGTPNDR